MTFVQSLFNLPNGYDYAVCVVVFFLVWLLKRYVWAVAGWIWKVLAEIKRPFVPWAWPTLWYSLAGGAVVWLLKYPIILGIQYADQRWVHPTYLVRDTLPYVTDIYEAEMDKYLWPTEMEIVRTRTREMAAKLGTTPLAIYEVAYSECGMNPYCVRKDGVAAGWIQFTRMGLVGLGHSLEEVKGACYNRDIRFLMDLTEAYLLSRAKGKALPRPCDIYTAVFAPGYVGCPDGQVLYSTKDGDAYDLNAGLDGWFEKQVNGGVLILRSDSHCDGKITIADLDLCLEAKKAKLISRYKK